MTPCPYTNNCLMREYAPLTCSNDPNICEEAGLLRRTFLISQELDKLQLLSTETYVETLKHLPHNPATLQKIRDEQERIKGLRAVVNAA